MSHTPGPWKYIKPDWKGMAYLFSKSTESTVATFFESPCNKSDCKLIAAAPELYEALEELRDKVWRIIDLHRISEARAEANMALERANAALAKARGNEEDENA